jgi:hypothetical protein
VLGDAEGLWSYVYGYMRGGVLKGPSPSGYPAMGAQNVSLSFSKAGGYLGMD